MIAAFPHVGNTGERSPRVLQISPRPHLRQSAVAVSARTEDLLFINKIEVDAQNLFLLLFDKPNFSHSPSPNMKTKLSLPSFLRALFNVLYYLVAIFSALFAVILLVGSLTSLGRDGRRSLNVPMLHDISLSVRASAVTAKTQTSFARDIEVEDIVTGLSINLFSQDPELASYARWTLLPPLLGMVIGSLVTLRLLRDLCARVAKGEVLTEENLKSVRNIGFLYVGFSIFEFIAHAGSIYFLGGYLARHATVSGISAKFDSSLSVLSPIPDGLVEGLIILLLAEAFRQGLALKKDADLTV